MKDIVRLFDLRRDQQDPEIIDATVRAGAQFAGTNLWVLFFAILIASVGLNVNATAVIIGAMLISPLMGPIVAVGYAAGVGDVGLIRLAVRNLAVFAALSLLTSAAYFFLSPLHEPQSELMARTSPTLWDVLIASFGGAAGMVAVTRRSFTNIVPGVAIATALMPPLCTMGFGLAHARWDMLGGAAYLFVINGVFIGAASLLVTRLLRLPARGQVDAATRRRQGIALGVVLAAVLAPSLWLGWRMVQQEMFLAGAARVVQALQADGSATVFSHEIDPRRRLLRYSVLAPGDDAASVQRVRAMFAQQGLRDVSVELRHAGGEPPDVNRLRRELRDDIDRTIVRQVQSNELRIRALELSARKQEESRLALARETAQLGDEIRAQYPGVSGVVVAAGLQAPAGGAAPADALLVVVEVARPLPAAARRRMESWLAVRLGRPVQVLERTAVHAAAARQ